MIISAVRLRKRLWVMPLFIWREWVRVRNSALCIDNRPVNCVASRVSSLGEPSIYLGEIYVLIKYLINRITACTCLMFVRRWGVACVVDLMVNTVTTECPFSRKWKRLSVHQWRSLDCGSRSRNWSKTSRHVSGARNHRKLERLKWSGLRGWWTKSKMVYKIH